MIYDTDGHGLLSRAIAFRRGFRTTEKKALRADLDGAAAHHVEAVAVGGREGGVAVAPRKKLVNPTKLTGATLGERDDPGTRRFYPSGAKRLFLPSKANSRRSTIRNVVLFGPSVGRQAASRTIENWLPSIAR